MQPQTKTTTLIGVAVLLAIVAGLLISLSNTVKQQRSLSIGSFQECALAGYPIMESFPEQCMTPDGRTFVNEAQREPATAPGGMSSNGCVVSGCSGQLCVSAEDAAAGGGISTCEYRAEYACYREASCEPQQNGKCGWTPTADLQRCLANPPSLDASLEITP